VDESGIVWVGRTISESRVDGRDDKFTVFRKTDKSSPEGVEAVLLLDDDG
jgi:hypothetical protein